MGWVVNTTPRTLYPRERPGTHCIGGWVGPRALLDECGKSHSHRDTVPGPSSSYWLAAPTGLSRPTVFNPLIYVCRAGCYKYSFLYNHIPLHFPTSIPVKLLNAFIIQWFKFSDILRSAGNVWLVKKRNCLMQHLIWNFTGILKAYDTWKYGHADVSISAMTSQNNDE